MLYLVATPIGNLGDISKRALEVLESCDMIACEDTRHTVKLLNAFGIKKPLVSFHRHNEAKAGQRLIEEALAGKNICLVSDAGCPGISDPGEYLVRLFQENNIPVTVIPGPNAALSALMVSGLPADRFSFEGFLDTKAGRRDETLVKLADEERTMIFYEAPHRIGRTLHAMVEIFGSERQAAVVKEITKIHEQIHKGMLGQLAERFSSEGQKGEFVIVVEGGHSEFMKPSLPLEERYNMLIGSGMDRKEAMRSVAKEYNVSRREVYSRVNGL